MKLITLEQVLQMHVLVVRETGGSTGLRDLKRLEAVLGTQQQSAFGKEAYPDPTQKAAALIRGIVAGHPFVDGNKRTAMLAGLTFLQVNNIPFEAQPGAIEDFAVSVATDKLDVQAVAAWLEQIRKDLR